MVSSVSGINSSAPSTMFSAKNVQPDPVKLAEALITENRSAGKGINYAALLRDIDQLIANDPALGTHVEEAVKAQLGVNGTKRLMAASYTIGTGQKALTMSRTAPLIEQYYKGTAHAKLATTPEEKVAFAKSDKAHYAKLDKLFGDGNARTYEGDKIDKGIGDMLRRGFTLDQVAQYKAVLIAEAKAAAASTNQGSSAATMVLDLTQMALDLTGIIDPTPISDGSNALISLGRGISDAFSGEWKTAGGNVANGLISAVGVVPYLGDLAKAGKIGAWAKTVSNAVEMMAKNPALAKKLEPMLREIRDLVNKLPQSMIDALPSDAKKAIESMKGKLDELFGASAKRVDDVAEPTVRNVDEGAKFIPPLRQQYIDAVEDLRAKAIAMREQGQSSEKIAKALNGERRELGEKFKDLAPPNLREKIYSRNIEKYGDKLGPTIEWLRSHGKTWEQIVESATRTGRKDLGF